MQRLELRQGADFFADYTVQIPISEPNPSKLSGRTFRWPSDDPKDTKPSVRVGWKPAGGPFTKFLFDPQFVMRLEFGQLKGNQLPGRIYLCVVDPEKSFVRGSFVAELKKGASAPP